MGKRSNFERREKDYYVTPYKGVLPLLPHLEPGTAYDEPCCGDGSLIRHLHQHGHVAYAASDIEPHPAPDGRLFHAQDAFTIERCRGQCFITNPPWSRGILHPLITHLSDLAPTWLLFDADWIHTKQSNVFLPRLRKIVSVGRLRWISGSKHDGKDNCCWYLFDEPSDQPPVFYGRGT